MKMLKSCLFVGMVIAAAIAFSSCEKGGKLTSITVAPAGISIANGTSLQYQAQGHLSDGTTYFLSTVNWSSSDPTKATIDANLGFLTASSGTTAATGTITIIASDPYSNSIGTTELTVARLNSVEITPVDPSMTQGTGHQFTATGTLSNGALQDLTSYATWSTSDQTIATAAAGGVVTALLTGATGTAAVTVTASFPPLFSSVTGSTTLIVTSVPLQSLAIDPSAAAITLATTSTQQFTATGTYTDGSMRDWTASAIWTSSNTAVATINAQGLATAVAPGLTTITAIDPITSISNSATFTVESPLSSIAVTPTLPSMTPGLTHQFTATGTLADSAVVDLTSTATWTSLTPAVATVASTPGVVGNGVVTSLATGTAIIEATDPATGITGATTLIVTSVPLQALAITPLNPTISQGTTLQFTATGTYTDNTTRDWTLSAIWSSSNKAAATIGVNGLATSVAAGATTISAIDPITNISTSATLTVQ